MSVGRNWDVIVVGGGPAGSSTATLVAKQGLRVLLLEKETFPRFRIGESFMPATWWTFEKLDVLSKLERSRFVRKHSVQFYLPNGRPTQPFYFSEIDPRPSSVTWQVDRGEFDKLLIEHAAESGVTVIQPAQVREVVFEGQRAVGVSADLPGSGRADLRASVVVDATGQSALLSQSLRLRRYDEKLRNAAVFTRFAGAARDPGIDEGATLVMHTADGEAWFWYIPLAGDVVSVGVVGPVERLTGRRGDLAAVLDEEISSCPSLPPRLKGSRQVGEIRQIRDFSYISERIAGDGWLLVGDAFGFLDPIYSSGVLLALKGAEMASEAIASAFEAGDFSAGRLGGHGPRFVEGMESLRRIVYAFYSPEFHFKSFLEKFPESRAAITNLLTGNVFTFSPERLFLQMDQVLPLPGYRPLSLATGPR